MKRRSEGGALGYDGSGRWPVFGNWFTLLYSFQKECSLRFRFREFKCFTELFGRGFTIVQSHLKLAEARQINQTPTFIIGNKQYGLIGMDEFSKAVNDALAAQDSSKTTTSKTAAKTTKKS